MASKEVERPVANMRVGNPGYDEAVVAEFEALLDALAVVVDTCEQLAEQQAMPDDWWVNRVDEARDLLRKHGRLP